MLSNDADYKRYVGCVWLCMYASPMVARLLTFFGFLTLKFYELQISLTRLVTVRSRSRAVLSRTTNTVNHTSLRVCKSTKVKIWEIKLLPR